MPEHISPEQLSSNPAVRKLASAAVELWILVARLSAQVEQRDREIEALVVELARRR